jgi:hypothetical protein
MPIRCGLPRPPIWPGSRAPPESTPAPTCAAISPGAPSAYWTLPGPAPASGAVHPVDAGGPPAQALHVSRNCSVTAGFYRTCVIDGVLEHSPAEHVRRPAVPAESPTLGFTHLQFAALLTTARQSVNRNDFALVAMLGLPGRRIFEATGADIGDLGEEHGHRVLRVGGKGGKVVLIPLLPADRPGGSIAPRITETPARSCLTATARGRTATPPRGGSGGSPRQRESRSPASSPYAPAHVHHDHARRRRGPARRQRPPRRSRSAAV